MEQLDPVAPVVGEPEAEGVVDGSLPGRHARREVDLGQEHEQGGLDLGVGGEQLAQLHLVAGDGVVVAEVLLDAVLRDAVDVAGRRLVQHPEPRRRTVARLLAVAQELRATSARGG